MADDIDMSRDTALDTLLTFIERLTRSSAPTKDSDRVTLQAFSKLPIIEGALSNAGIDTDRAYTDKEEEYLDEVCFRTFELQNLLIYNYELFVHLKFISKLIRDLSESLENGEAAASFLHSIREVSGQGLSMPCSLGIRIFILEDFIYQNHFVQNDNLTFELISFGLAF